MTGQQTAVAGRDRALWWSAAGHSLLVLVILIGGFVIPRPVPPTHLAIRATVVDSAARSRPAARPKPEPKALPESKTEPEPKPGPKPEPKPQPKPKPEPGPKPQLKPEPKPVPDAAKLQAKEQQIKAQQAAEQQQKAEQLKAEKLAERAKAEAAREAAERRREIEADEHQFEATDSGALAQYVAVIRQKVERNWVRPPGAKPGLECEVLVTQIPGGQVVDVQMGRCNADDAVRRSIEAAVLRASPLPPPDDTALFERNLRFVFKPEQ